VFTARYALSPYIKQIRFVFKGLIPLGISEFREIQHSEGHTLITGPKKLPYFQHRSSGLDKIRYERCPQIFAVIFVKIFALKAILYSRGCMNFYPYIPHLFFDLPEIQYKRSAHNSVEHWRVS
jgi:hypothetical protein